jgi:hypothetical protein
MKNSRAQNPIMVRGQRRPRSTSATLLLRSIPKPFSSALLRKPRQNALPKNTLLTGTRAETENVANTFGLRNFTFSNRYRFAFFAEGHNLPKTAAPAGRLHAEMIACVSYFSLSPRPEGKP